MRTFRKIVLPMLSILAFCITSCSNDYEQWDYDYEEKDTWETELRNIVSDLDFLFENSNVKFLGAEELNCKVDITDFLNNETCYPVCIKNLYNFFTLQNQNFILKDTCNIHKPAVAIKDMVTNVVNHQDKYVFVRLKWQSKNKIYTTVAAFDKSNGQIIYDNILTNIPYSQVEIPTRKSKLTRSEGGGDIVTAIFYKDRMRVSYNGYYFDFKVRGLCNVHDDGYGNYTLDSFKAIETQFCPPPYPNGMFYPRYDLVIYENEIVYFYG